MPTITIKNNGSIAASPDRRLVLAIEGSGFDVLHRCGGWAQCTTCRVVFLKGEPDKMTVAERDRLQQRGLLGQVRLSCQILCEHDMTIEVVKRLSTSDLPDAGPTPHEVMTPKPVWIDRPETPPEAD